MKKTIKIFLITVLCLAIAAIPLLGNAAEGFMTVSYDANARAVKLSGMGMADSGQAVILHIVPEAQGEPSHRSLPVISDMFIVGQGGSIENLIKLPSDFENGKYTVYVMASSFETSSATDLIICLEGSDETKAAINAVNRAKTKVEFKSAVEAGNYDLGIDVESETDFDSMINIMYSIKNAEGDLTFEEFSKAADLARASIMIDNGASVNEVMQKYASAFGTTYSEYISINNDIKTELDNLIKNLDHNNGFADYKELIAVATVIGAEGYGYMRDYILDNKELFDIYTNGDYEDLSVNNKSKVFKNMYADRKNFETTDDVKDAFNAEVKSLKKSSSSSSSGSGSGSGGSSFGKSSYTEPAPVLPSQPSSPVEVPEAKESYTDISSHFAKDYIEMLSSYGVINGFEDGTFRPEDFVTREQACKMVAIAFGLGESGESQFADVSKDRWSYGCISALFQKGIVKGNGVEFNPEANITRQDAAVIIARALEAQGKSFEGEYAFEDADKIADYAKGYVYSLAANGFLKGDGTNFMPKNNITRGEIAAIIGRLISEIK